MTAEVKASVEQATHVELLHSMLAQTRTLCRSDNPFVAGTGERVWSILSDCVYELDLDLDLPQWLATDERTHEAAQADSSAERD